MANDNQFDNNDGHLVLSHNLLTLLQWLIDHEAETFKRLIHQAIQHGFMADYPQYEPVELHLADDSSQQSVVEFLSMLDTLLVEATNEKEVNNFLNRTRMPVLDHLDTISCDSHTVQTSIERAQSKLEHNPQENLEKLMLQELLRRWKPDKKYVTN